MVLNCFCERKGAYIMQVNIVTINPNFIQITDPTDHTSLFHNLLHSYSFVCASLKFGLLHTFHKTYIKVQTNSASCLTY